MNYLIGVGGSPRSGKDTIAKYLESEHGFHRYAFADYLKWIATEYFGFSKEELWDNKTEESRRFLQNLGAFCTDIDPEMFINKVVSKMKADQKKCAADGVPYLAVVSDVRKKIEMDLFSRNSTAFLVYDTIMNSGVSMKNAFDKIVLVKVERPIELILKEEPGLENTMKHKIEQLANTCDKWDYLISNNEDLTTLKLYVDRLVSDLKEGSDHDSNQRENV